MPENNPINEIIIDAHGTQKSVQAGSTVPPEVVNLEKALNWAEQHPQSPEATSLMSKLREALVPQTVQVLNQRLDARQLLVNAGVIKDTPAQAVIPERFTTKPELSINEKLPEYLEEVLNDIRPDAPAIYKTQAREAAYFFWSLESDKELIDQNGQSFQPRVNRFVDQLATTQFALWAYNDPFSPHKAHERLPSWLLQRMQELDERTNSSPDEVERIRQFYEAYAQTHGTKDVADQQIYYQYQDGVLPKTSDRELKVLQQSKAYIEDESLLNTEAVQAMLDSFREQHLHPNTTKLFEQTRLVMYWKENISEADKQAIQRIAAEHQVKMRGFAQDPVAIELSNTQSVDSSQQQYRKFFRLSNDGSLGEGKHNEFLWEEAKYDPKRFFRQYLRLTFFGQKNPSEPYQMSFVLLTWPEGQEKEKYQQILHDLETKITQEGKGVYMADHPYIDAFPGQIKSLLWNK